MSPQSEEDGCRYVTDFRDAKHNHPLNDQKSGLRHLPARMFSEAKQMKNNLHMSLQDTVEVIEDKHIVIINPKSMKQMLEYERALKHPKELECTKLLEKLK